MESQEIKGQYNTSLPQQQELSGIDSAILALVKETEDVAQETEDKDATNDNELVETPKVKRKRANSDDDDDEMDDAFAADAYEEPSEDNDSGSGDDDAYTEKKEVLSISRSGRKVVKTRQWPNSGGYKEEVSLPSLH